MSHFKYNISHVHFVATCPVPVRLPNLTVNAGLIVSHYPRIGDVTKGPRRMGFWGLVKFEKGGGIFAQEVVT